ncbi:MAG: presenilin family intramembrane aspartyl protease [Candidatus Nanoarchaeia archaeon]
MKHNLKITLFLVVLFLCSQLMGLVIINQYVDIEQSSSEGHTKVKESAFEYTGQRPPDLTAQEEKYVWVYISAAILLGTIMVLAIIKFKILKLWMAWFILSIIICLYFALAQFIAKLLRFIGINPGFRIINPEIVGFPVTILSVFTLIVVSALAYMKVIKKNVVIHNITEIFIYGGLAALIISVGIHITAALALLVIISLYDMIAVWKTKHMVTMAKYQTENKLFAGLMMPYNQKTGKISFKTQTTKKISKSSGTLKNAILGGGDVAFPLIFAGTVMKAYASFLYPVIIVITTTIALFLLLTYGKKNRYYPAMPFISGGSLAGYAIVLLI